MLAKTGLLILSNPRQIGKVLSSAEVQKRVKNTLYIQLLSALGEPFGNFYPSLFQTWASFSKTVSKIYSQAATDCKNLDVRVILSTLKYPTTQIHTQRPINLVIFDRTHSSHDIDLFLQSRIVNLAKDCSFVTIDCHTTASATHNVEHEINSIDSLREWVSLTEDKVYRHTVLGGTFDRLHIAHKMLLSEAVLRAKEKITVGVTEENMLKGKTLCELIEPCHIRVENLRHFLYDISPDLDLNIVPITDSMGPTKSDPTMEMIVVSSETMRGGNQINEVRVKNNMQSLDIISIDLLDEPFPNPVEEVKISSSTGRMRLLGTLLKPVVGKPLGNRPYVIGLTGGIASGKSKAALYMQEKLNAQVINCDKIAHDLYAPGKPCFKSVVQHFGDRIVSEHGEINRKELGAIVFKDPAELNKLNTMVWPLIIKEVVELINNTASDIVVIEAAVLLTAGWQSICNEVWSTIIPKEEAIKRLIDRNSLTEEQAISRIESQHPPKYYVENAHVVICSLWTVDYTRSQIDTAWTLLKERISDYNQLKSSI